MQSLCADVARLVLRVVRAFCDGLSDGLLVFFVGVVLFCVAAAVYLLAHLLVAAAPVVMLASGTTISCVTSNASRRGVGQWRGAGGASCEDHFAFCGELLVRAAALIGLKNPIFSTHKTPPRATRTLYRRPAYADKTQL